VLRRNTGKRQIHIGSVRDESFLRHPVIPGDQGGFVPDVLEEPGAGKAVFGCWLYLFRKCCIRSNFLSRPAKAGLAIFSYAYPALALSAPMRASGGVPGYSQSRLAALNLEGFSTNAKGHTKS
jgi:hypothetical protein